MDKAYTHAKTDIALKTASNKALKNYFDELVMPAYVEQGAEHKIDSQIAKIDDAQRLLQKAQALALLMDNSVISEMSADFSLEKPYFEDAPVQQDIQKSIQACSQNALKQNNHQEKLTDAEIRDTSVDLSSIRDTAIGLQEHLEPRFQALLCEVAGLTLAIPLVELGGIHRLSKITNIVGKPCWFLGVLIKGSETFNCIDIAPWLAPQKYTPQLAQSNDYKFAVQLGKTPYVICCNSIDTTIELSKGDVKWRKQNSKQPWLAGLVKQQMCALIDGAKMVQLVSRGIS